MKNLLNQYKTKLLQIKNWKLDIEKAKQTRQFVQIDFLNEDISCATSIIDDLKFKICAKCISSCHFSDGYKNKIYCPLNLTEQQIETNNEKKAEYIGKVLARAK